MFDKTIKDYAGFAEPYSAMAEDRVIAEPQLSPYHDLFIERGWPHHDDHWRWVANAPIEELIAWATEIRADEADEAEPEPFKYEQVVRLTITLYPAQMRVVEALAHDRHRGKKSPAIQDIIDNWDGYVRTGSGGMR